MKTITGVLFGALVYFLLAGTLRAQALPEIRFFYSETCPHCIAEHKFLDILQEESPTIIISRYPISDPENRILLENILREADKSEYLGSVPITVIGNNVILGFDNSEGIGSQIRNLVNAEPKQSEKVVIPIIGNTDLTNYPLPLLAIMLGFLDGFNVCSLGALALILGLVLVLQDRKKILLYGGVFILTTAIIYGALIFLWHRVFMLVASYTMFLELAIGLLGVIGGYTFFKEYQACRKLGPSCKFGHTPLVGKFSRIVQNSFQKKASWISLASAIFSFAAVITIVEFPCSAALPVVFAGVLADHNLQPAFYLGLIALFVLLYMLDELIVYVIAVTRMSIWLSNPKFMIYTVLIEGILLFAIGTYYLINAFNLV